MLPRCRDIGESDRAVMTGSYQGSWTGPWTAINKKAQKMT
jgi:hypothetical protein